MKLSVFLNHIREGAKQQGLSEAEALKKVREKGISGIELDLGDYDREGDGLMDSLRQAGFGISWVYGFHQWEAGTNFATGEHHVDVALKVGASGILVIPGFVSEEEAVEMNRLTADKDALYAWMDGNAKVQGMVAGLKHMMEYADGRIHLTLEDFDGSTAPFATLNGLCYFMDHVPGLKFAMDCGNFAYSDEDAWTAFVTLHDRIVHVHTKDRGEEPEVRAKGLKVNKGLAAVAAGDGYMPVGSVVETMQKEGYQGWYAIEHFNSEDHMTAMARSAAYLKSFE